MNVCQKLNLRRLIESSVTKYTLYDMKGPCNIKDLPIMGILCDIESKLKELNKKIDTCGEYTKATAILVSRCLMYNVLYGMFEDELGGEMGKDYDFAVERYEIFKESIKDDISVFDIKNFDGMCCILKRDNGYKIAIYLNNYEWNIVYIKDSYDVEDQSIKSFWDEDCTLLHQNDTSKIHGVLVSFSPDDGVVYGNYTITIHIRDWDYDCYPETEYTQDSIKTGFEACYDIDIFFVTEKYDNVTIHTDKFEDIVDTHIMN